MHTLLYNYLLEVHTQLYVLIISAYVCGEYDRVVNHAFHAKLSLHSRFILAQVGHVELSWPAFQPQMRSERGGSPAPMRNIGIQMCDGKRGIRQQPPILRRSRTAACNSARATSKVREAVTFRYQRGLQNEFLGSLGFPLRNFFPALIWGRFGRVERRDAATKLPRPGKFFWIARSP